MDRIQSSCCWSPVFTRASNSKVYPPATKCSPILILKPEHANPNKTSIGAAAWRSLWVGWPISKFVLLEPLCLQGPRTPKSTHPCQNAFQCRSGSLKTQTRMKLALRLQRGEAFGPGGPISKFVLAVVIRSGWGLGWAALSKENLPTRDKTHSNLDPEA